MPTVRTPAAVLASLILVLMSTVAPATTVAESARDLLPDLRMVKPKDVRLVRYTNGPFAGRTLLRFTTTILNGGPGPLELRGSRACSSIVTCPSMTVRQRIRQQGGRWRSIRTDATMQYEVGDGHRHWHAVDLEGYRLLPLGVADPKARRAAKFGFCFFDGIRATPHAPTSGLYRESGCGTTTSVATMVGLTQGWADIYPWDFAGQYVDATGLPAGQYLLCVTADPRKSFRQSHTFNDQAWVRLRIAGDRLRVQESRRGSCAAERTRWPVTPSGTTDTLASAASAIDDRSAEGTVTFATVERSAPSILCRIRTVAA